MGNPLFEMMNNPNGNLIRQFMDFKRNFRGNPYEEIQRLLNNGTVTQEQYNQAVRMAQQFQSMLK